MITQAKKKCSKKIFSNLERYMLVSHLHIDQNIFNYFNLLKPTKQCEFDTNESITKNIATFKYSKLSNCL